MNRASHPAVLPADACSRRSWITRGVAASTVWLLPLPEAAATPESMSAAIERFTSGRPVHGGRVSIELAELVENGNTVPITVRVQSPMSAGDHVRRIALFAQRNPLPEMAVFHLGPRSGRAVVSTRVRLATSQRVMALAELSNGSYWQGQADVVVTLAACIEGS